MGAPLDMDYARELADALEPMAFTQPGDEPLDEDDETKAAEAFAERAWSGNS